MTTISYNRWFACVALVLGSTYAGQQNVTSGYFIFLYLSCLSFLVAALSTYKLPLQVCVTSYNHATVTPPTLIAICEFFIIICNVLYVSALISHKPNVAYTYYREIVQLVFMIELIILAWKPISDFRKYLENRNTTNNTRPRGSYHVAHSQPVS